MGSDPDPTLDLPRLRELEKKATPGEWYDGPSTLAGNVWVYSRGVPLLEPLHFIGKLVKPLFGMRSDDYFHKWIPGETTSAKDDRFWKQKQCDAAFICALRNSAPALLDLVESQEREIKRLLAERAELYAKWNSLDTVVARYREMTNG